MMSSIVVDDVYYKYIPASMPIKNSLPPCPYRSRCIIERNVMLVSCHKVGIIVNIPCIPEPHGDYRRALGELASELRCALCVDRKITFAPLPREETREERTKEQAVIVCRCIALHRKLPISHGRQTSIRPRSGVTAKYHLHKFAHMTTAFENCVSY